MGPRETTGKYVRPTTTTTTTRSSTKKSGVLVGKVPAVAGTDCLRASEPAIASTGTIRMKRPKSIVRPSVVLYQSVLPVRPPKAEPLLFAADVNAYTTSESPCGPGLRIEDSGPESTTEIDEKPRITSGITIR